MKEKMKKILIKTLFVLLFGLIIFAVGTGIAFLIAMRFDYLLEDVMFVEGLLVFIIGMFSAMKGNPSGGSINGIGMRNESAISFQNLETTRLERQYTNYYKNFLKNSIVDFGFSSITIMLGGAFIIGFGIFFL